MTPFFTKQKPLVTAHDNKSQRAVAVKDYPIRYDKGEGRTLDIASYELPPRWFMRIQTSYRMLFFSKRGRRVYYLICSSKNRSKRPSRRTGTPLEH